MNKKKILLSLMLSSMLTIVNIMPAIAAENNVTTIDNEMSLTTVEHNANFNNEEFQQSNNQDEVKYEFEELDEQTITKMKEDLKAENGRRAIEEYSERLSFSSTMATLLNAAGFPHSAEALDYSMLSIREEPKIYGSGSSLSSDIWSYSIDFESAVRAFLYQARSSGSYEYFAKTSLSFSQPSVDFSTPTMKRMDLFGTLHSVDAYLGVVKEGGLWYLVIQLEDVYDFKHEQAYSFVNYVNNIVNYEQELGLVKPYKIIVYANKSGLFTLPFGVPNW
ncbi:hypothetical protein [Clostridium sp. ATCC 25772]|uniref:hypothetical protein n=1 Tax=Clostridium sp. ATCC 25772 TaxID=1676991 RepID=UPI000785B1D4|nr:hypothetical protein [Clostridium sp. ATCC 25772]